MENASKALLIAGGVLIAVLILSAGVYLVMTSKEVGTTYGSVAEENETKSFNSNFIQFLERTDITAHEIVTIINYSKEYEREHGAAPNIIIKNAPNYTTDKISNNSIGFITMSSEKGWTFSCKSGSISYDEKGRVNSITFVKNN